MLTAAATARREVRKTVEKTKAGEAIFYFKHKGVDSEMVVH